MHNHLPLLACCRYYTKKYQDLLIGYSFVIEVYCEWMVKYKMSVKWLFYFFSLPRCKTKRTRPFLMYVVCTIHDLWHHTMPDKKFNTHSWHIMYENWMPPSHMTLRQLPTPLVGITNILSTLDSVMVIIHTRTRTIHIRNTIDDAHPHRLFFNKSYVSTT